MSVRNYPQGVTLLVQAGLNARGCHPPLTLDDAWGHKTEFAFQRDQHPAYLPVTGEGGGDAAATGRVLTGDGTWPFYARIDGEDIVCEDILITCFGGWGDGHNADPQDDGRTASGVNTKTRRICGVSIAMDAAQFPQMEQRDPAGYRALLGAPFPRIPWSTPVEVTIDGETFTPPDGIVDLGPGKQASKPGQPHALDLTPRAAQHFLPRADLKSLARGFSERGSFRILGAAKYCRADVSHGGTE